MLLLESLITANNHWPVPTAYGYKEMWHCLFLEVVLFCSANTKAEKHYLSAAILHWVTFH